MTDEQIRAARTYCGVVCASWGIPWQDRDDATQTALLALWRSMPDYDPSRSSWLTWASFILRRKLCNFLTSQKRYKRRLELLADSHPSPLLPIVNLNDDEYPDPFDLVADEHDLYAEVDNRLDAYSQLVRDIPRLRLSNLEREAVYSRFLEESEVEAASRIGTTPKGIDNALYRVTNKRFRVAGGDHA